MTEKAFKIGVIGHRDLGNIERHTYTQFCCHQLLARSKQKYSNIVAISAISDGADSIFAQSAISLGINLDSIIPFGQFSSDFEEELAYERYRFLRSHSKYVTSANFSERSKQAYKKSMEWVVFKSNAIVAIWDGRKEGAMGGTWEAVSLSMKIRKTLIHIDNENRSINLYYNKGNKYLLHQNLSIDQIITYL
ncbi:MAG: hypothetical protein ACXWT4_10320 [Methylobacter sp.]